MDVLGFVFAQSTESNDHEVRPQVDGVDAIDALGSERLGLDPPEFFFQPGISEGGSLLIGRCSCGVVGCDDLRVGVVLRTDRVEWRAQERLFVFDREQYQAAVAGAARDTSWESAERTAERLVMGLDFTSRLERGYALQWASARIGHGKLTLSFNKDGSQVLIDVGWDGVHPDDAVRSVRRWVADDA